MALLCLAYVCVGILFGFPLGSMGSVGTTRLQDSLGGCGSCVCQLSCGEQAPNSSLIVELISRVSSMHTSDNIMFSRVLASINELKSLLETKTSSLEANLAAQDRLLESVKDKVEADEQALTQLQESMDQQSPPVHYRSRYRVFHVASSSGSYRLSQIEARALCLSKGAKLATVAQLEAAWKHGMQVCACGWLDDGSSRYPIQWPQNGCGAGPAGIRVCEGAGYSGPILRDAYCFS